jgi:hypothetical protein
MLQGLFSWRSRIVILWQFNKRSATMLLATSIGTIVLASLPVIHNLMRHSHAPFIEANFLPLLIMILGIGGIRAGLAKRKKESPLKH